MKKNRPLLFAFVFTMMFLLGSRPSMACALKFGWEEWEPYSFAGQGGAVTGLDVEITQAIAESAGCSLELTDAPWARLLSDVSEGKIDFVSGASLTEERSRFGNYTQAYRNERVSLMVRKGQEERFSFNSVDDLMDRDLRLGLKRGAWFGPEVDVIRKDQVLSSQIEESASIEIQLKKLLASRVDAIVVDHYAGISVARVSRVQDLVVNMERAVHESPIFFLFSKQKTAKDNFDKFDQTIGRLLQDGTIQGIIQKYR